MRWDALLLDNSALGRQSLTVAAQSASGHRVIGLGVDLPGVTAVPLPLEPESLTDALSSLLPPQSAAREAGLYLDPQGKRGLIGSAEIRLSDAGFRLLSLLHQRSPFTLATETALRTLWGHEDTENGVTLLRPHTQPARQTRRRRSAQRHPVSPRPGLHAGVVMTRYQVRANLDPAALQELFDASWPGNAPCYRPRQLDSSLAWVSAHDGERLIGFVNVAWDGGVHAFLLDTTVHPEYRHRRIGAELVGKALTVARAAGCTWLHVDFEPELARFYESCGFEPTAAGLLRL